MALGRRVFGGAIVVVLVMAGYGGGWLMGRRVFGSAVNPASLTVAERQFIERMHDVTMVGSSTAAGKEGAAPHASRYGISSVEKVGEGQWRFNVVMHCCGVDGAIPVVVPMQWNGDTPMVTLTDATLPGLGTFTVRVLFYGDRYAGIWQHGTAGGSMSGRIENSRVDP